MRLSLATCEAEPAFPRAHSGIDDVLAYVSKTGAHRCLPSAETALTPPNEQVRLLRVRVATEFEDATNHAEPRKVLKIHECSIDGAPDLRNSLGGAMRLSAQGAQHRRRSPDG